jgi:hypothetical protein
MEPPIGVSIQKIPKKSSDNYNGSSGGTYKSTEKSIRHEKIVTFLCSKGVLYRKESLQSAAEMVGKRLNGSSFMRFKVNGYHRFNTGDFIYSDIEKLPENLKKIVKELQE